MIWNDSRKKQIKDLWEQRLPKDLREQMYSQHHCVSIRTQEVHAVDFSTPCCSCENKSQNAFHRDFTS